MIRLLCFFITLTIIWTQILRANTDYTEFYFGDASTSLVAFGREVLSSDDVRECSPSNTAHINPHAFLKSLDLDSIDYTKNQPLTPPRQNQNFDNLLIGFPITALSQRMAIGAVVTHIFSPPNLKPPQVQNLMYHKLSRMPVKEIQPRLIASKEGKCLLTFDTCSHRWSCHPKNSRGTFLQVPILGISKKHNALIFDPSQLGISLENARKLKGTQFLEKLKLTNLLGLNPKNAKTSIVDFVNSLLIFDVNAQVSWLQDEPFPQITSRWFLNFNLVSSEEGFQSRPPTEGVGYSLNTKEESRIDIVEEIPKRIIRYRIFKNGQIKPIKYYVKNVPEQYQPAFQQAFEYWQSIFTSLISHPILSYEFIQGDFDKNGQEIIAGDVRFNVVEWDNTLRETNKQGTSFELFNPNTGEVWSSYIVIDGAPFIETHQKRFQYSKLVREGLSLSSHKNSEDISLSQVSLFDQLTAFVQVKPHYLLLLAHHDGTFESYIMSFVENLAAHEIGHTLGLVHNFKGSVSANGAYGTNTNMDFPSIRDSYKKSSGDYDQTAIGYGYLGIPPYRTDMFCGDKNLVYNYFDMPIKDISPECAKHDASSNPLQYTALELREIVDLLTIKSYIQPRPYLIWNAYIRGHIASHLYKILPYYFLADTHYDQLQSVLIDGRKPQTPQEVKDLVLSILKSFTCDPTLLDILNRTEKINQEPTNFDQHLQKNVVNFFNLFNQTVITNTDISLSDLNQCS